MALFISTPSEFFVKSGHGGLGRNPGGVRRSCVIGLIPHIGKLHDSDGTVHDVLVVIGPHPSVEVKPFVGVSLPGSYDLLGIAAARLL